MKLVLLKPVKRVAGARSRRPQSSPNQPGSHRQAEVALVLGLGRQRPFRLQSSSVLHARMKDKVVAPAISDRTRKKCITATVGDGKESSLTTYNTSLLVK